MKEFRYLDNVATLKMNTELCVGCQACETVCPHRVFMVEEGKARIVDLNGCMECGACAKNCPPNAITLTPGVGCAAYIIGTWLKKKGLTDGASACC